MKAKLTLSVILLTVFVLSGCEKTSLKCTDDQEFCAVVSAGEYDRTGPIINKYLSGQDKQMSGKDKLAALADWLNCKSCISQVEILCNSCIYTNPPQSELRILFSTAGQNTEKILDILMSEPLKFAGFHHD